MVKAKEFEDEPERAITQTLKAEKILKKAIKKIYSDLALNKNQLVFVNEEPIEKNGYMWKLGDAVGYLKGDLKNPFIIIEIKVGPIMFKLNSEQFKKDLSASKSKYGVLTNGKNYYFFENNPKKGVVNISSLPKKTKQ